MDAIRFEVAYRFAEYRQFVLAHLRDGGVEGGFLGRLFFSVVAAVVFRVKMHKVGKCAYVIDDAGLRRQAKDGEVVVAWKDIARIHRYPPGYLIAKVRGAFPIPYRCLDAAQREALETLIETHAPGR